LIGIGEICVEQDGVIMGPLSSVPVLAAREIADTRAAIAVNRAAMAVSMGAKPFEEVLEVLRDQVTPEGKMGIVVGQGDKAVARPL